MDFSILGTLAVRDGVRERPLGAPKVRTLLALLLCRPGEPVPVGTLVDGLWAGSPPRSAAKNLQLYVHQLRRSLGEPDRVSLRAGGYALTVLPGELDAERFEVLAAQARDAAEREDFLTADAVSRQALAMWQGSPFGELADDVRALRTEAERLGERRLAVLGLHLEAELQLGRHQEVVPRLRELVAEHPLREGLHAQLMLALYRSGRQAEALEVFRRVRGVLASELGLRPSSELSDLAQAILRSDRWLDPVSRRPVSPPPDQLPPGVATFTGRESTLRALDAAADLVDPVAPGDAVPIVVVTGTAGVGKTALAVRWAHRVADLFPDGRLYVNLHGYGTASATTPAEVLARFLRALDVPAERVPAHLDELTALYRSTVRGKRLLVVLDNAGSVDQVRPLVPGTPGSLVLVTSRDDLRGLAVSNDATVLRLDVLTSAESTRLLERVVGVDRVAAERSAALDLVRLCARLPLALRIAAAHLASGRERTLAECVAALGGADRLDRLSVPGDPSATVRTAFELSYRTLDGAARRLFRLIGSVPTHHVTEETAAVLLDADVAVARRGLGDLVRAHLLEVDADGRHHCHDLLRLYAAELAAVADEDREEARGRLYDRYRDTATAASARLTPQMLRLPRPTPPQAVEFDADAAALAWLETERANLVAVVRDAAERGPRPIAWLLADALRGYFWLRRHAAEWLLVADLGATAARADGAVRGLISAEQSLAQAYRGVGDHARAIVHYTRAVGLAEQDGWTEAEAAARGNVAGLYWELGRLDDAVAELNRTIELNRRTGWQPGLGTNLLNLGTLYRELGRPHEAAEQHALALEIQERIGSKSGAAHAHANMAEAFFDLGRLSDARDSLREALRLHRDTGGRYGEITALVSLTAVHAETGDHAEAATCGRTALELARETGDRRAEASVLAALAGLDGAPDPETLAGQALRLAREIDYPRAETEALLALAAAHLRDRRFEEALSTAVAAADLAARHTLRLPEAKAHMLAANAHLACRRPDQARTEAHLALDLHRRTSNRIGESRTLGVLGRIALAQDDVPGGRALLRQAIDLIRGCGSTETTHLLAALPE
ncbi:BTAD domain-containing putative transcriptional regulator [Actinosynnema sp. NPDC020468]|uniref:AfsR/SARP family transcriptional regulator n=1 Tax=Actinosynnema sp. NPDC020468 TaxID=3154488 RepID=UPI0033E7F54D